MSQNKVLEFLRVLGLSVIVLMGGCVSIDNVDKPDYVLIELAAVVAFTVIVNETVASDKAVQEAYDGLTALENKILTPDSELDLYILDRLLLDAVPLEYKALASTGSTLIRSRVRSYMNTRLPEYSLTETEVTLNVTLAVVQGAKAALGPKYEMINK